MSFNLDIALDEIKRLNVADDLKQLLVEATHGHFAAAANPVEAAADSASDGSDADVAADPEGDADTSGASPEGNEGASAAATDSTAAAVAATPTESGASGEEP